MLLNCVWLKTLKYSNRSSSFGTSPNENVLNRDQLKLNSPGPTTASFPALPKPWFGPPFQGATGISERAGAEPCEPLLRVGDWRNQVRTVGGAAAQADRVMEPV